MTNRTLILIIAILLVVGSIIYLEAGKNRISISNNPSGSDIPVEVTVQNTAQETASSSAPRPSPSPISSNPPPPPKPVSISDRVQTKQSKFPRVKEISSPDGFINTNEGFKLADVVGKKVILVDFWTYSCINCQRTTPYLNAWYEKYKNQGFEIVGIHTPEFEFEKNYQNVLNAVHDEHIQYPVVLDNDYSTWTAYENRFWPRRYLIDIDGFIVFDQIGEGGYDVMERQIQLALAERSLVLGSAQIIAGGMVNPNTGKDAPSEGSISRETYFGASRNEFLVNGSRGVTGEQTFTDSSDVQSGGLYLAGTWNVTSEYAENKTANAKIKFRYRAKNVYFVASAAQAMNVKILRDGKPLSAAEAGEDVKLVNGEALMSVKEDQLYKLIHESAVTEHTLEIIIPNPGLRAFTFTFG